MGNLQKHQRLEIRTEKVKSFVRDVNYPAKYEPLRLKDRYNIRRSVIAIPAPLYAGRFNEQPWATDAPW